ncbi:MAG: site-specific integrase [Thermodesulfovibrionales bacterium]|nr:site-specific integrase [Thermodesulfovibrionales bacterium]
MGLFRRNKIWWMSFTAKGKHHRESTGTEEKKLAEKIYAKVKTRVVEETWFDFKHSLRRTLGEMISRYENEYTVAKDYYQKARDKSIFKNLKSYFGEDCTLADIENVIGGYEQWRKADGIKPATILKELALLRRMFNVARKQWKWKMINPVSEIELPKVKNARVRYLDLDEEARLYAALDKAPENWLKPFVYIALDTGLRLNNLRELSWSEVNLFSGMIIIDAEKMKNDDYIGIPLTDRAYQILKDLWKVQCVSGHVFNDDGQKLYDRKVQRALKRFLNEAQIENFHFHDLRHTFASWKVQSGVDMYVVQKLLGHKDNRITQRYAHLNVDALKDAILRQNRTLLSHLSRKEDERQTKSM